VLLAALLRRSGVPARLVYGFLFTEGGFVGHAWTEAWIRGAWCWLDPSFPGGRPYALKLPLGTIDPAEPLGTEVGLTLLRLAGGVRAELVGARLDPEEKRGAGQ
jgi:transglutaminase-like putative cysteine protease